MNNIPQQLKYTKTHEWILVEDNEVTLGITEHAQHLLGDLVFVELPEVGSTVCVGDDIGVVESVKAASDFYTPIGGTVIGINQRVSEDPAIVNRSPQEAGWLVKIKPNSLSELDSLLDAKTYAAMISEEE